MRRPAFTLIEMLIVVLIVAIVAAMAVARLGNTNVTKLRAAAQMLAADLSYAQIESIGHAADPRVMVFDTAADAYHIAPASDIDTPIINPATRQAYRVTFGQGAAHAFGGVKIAAISAGADDSIGFGIYGQIDQAAAATITLAAGGNRVIISVHPVTGEATIGDIE